MQIPFKYWLLLLLLGVFWGFSFIFSKIAVSEIAPSNLVFLRVGLAGAILWAWVLISGKRPKIDLATLRNWMIMGLLANAIPFSFLFFGQQHIGAGLASIINASTVLWTAIFAHFLLSDEKLNFTRSIGILIGFAGIVILIGPSAVKGIGTNLIAELCIVVATISYGFAGIFSRRFKNNDPLVTAAGQLTCASIWVLPLAFIFGDGVAMPAISMNAALALAGLVIISTALAYALFFYIVATIGAVNVALVTLIAPMIAVLAGILFLNEQLSFNQYLGMVSILLGLVIIDERLSNFMMRNKKT